MYGVYQTFVLVLYMDSSVTGTGVMHRFRAGLSGGGAPGAGVHQHQDKVHIKGTVYHTYNDR